MYAFNKNKMASPHIESVRFLMNQMTLADLQAVQAHVASLISDFASEEKLLTDNQLRQEVIKMASDKSKKFKAGWRKLILQRSLVENVFGILEEAYSSLRTKSSNPDGWKAARELGGRDTLKWQNFKLRVIQHLYAEGSFGDEEGFRDFEDTADGCDEIAWDAACYLLGQAAA